ncbi:uncharacterized protein LACBIDRAFT_311255 [Laccaria bicolor S238N-H82]|uniref:Predicted protein n=1 Tax=Laccaria bicolor (strain S238N-H82 / ATCC MYA-4686) TaxID=486041 RepID=B0CZK2_LACBS|nr:uncharacterized protein LACBIDRAFT_311255 [Laccaria bicolor S238N-H82]EDR12159.1 predicted protein [Laccaria bicolor S238N-H82]|eukprot:XP_001876423.1 predicted protein [Laccaria bicolor S238N-H82]
MDSASASGQHSQESPPPWSESSDSESFTSNVLDRFVDRTISIVSLDSITHLPRYSVSGGQQPLDQEIDANIILSTHGEITSRCPADDGDITTTSGGVPHRDGSILRASPVSPPHYSSTPPRYSGVFGASAQQITAEGLSRTEHTYNICSGLKNKPWATFRIFSEPPVGAAQKHQKFPRFSGGDMVAGLIEFASDSSQTVNSITVSLRGRIIRGYLAGESDTFLDHQVSIWTRASGDPRFPNPGSTKKFDGKLKGAYQFPFAFPFPTHVDVSTSTAISLPLPTPLDPVVPSPSPAPSSTPATPSSKSFLSATTPSASHLRSFSSPTDPSFASSSRNVHMGTNHQFTGSHISGISTANIPLSGRRKRSSRPQNEVDPFSVVPSSTGESEKARLRRALEERDRAHAEIQGNRSRSPSTHTYPTPQTFLEHGIHANVQYELSLHIAHGMLRPASKLRTAIVYTPSTTPSPASVARQLAYTEGASVPGPAADPVGWQTLPKVMVCGELLGRRKVEVECTLSLAKPLCYTRGTVIPCYLTLESSNSHALGLLSTPKSPFVRLTRRVRYSQDASSTIDNKKSKELTSPLSTPNGDSVVPNARSSTSSRPGGRDVKMVNGGRSGEMIEEVDEVELAVWRMPPMDATQEMNVKNLEGEIHLAKDLQPTCKFLPFSVEYAVELLPLVSHAFEPIPPDREHCLIVQPVEIATHHSEGPMPTAFSQPMSDREREKKKKEREKRKEHVEIMLSRGLFET